MSITGTARSIGSEFGMTVAQTGYRNTDAVKQKLSQARKGQFGAVRQLGPLALALVLLAITVGMGAVVLGEMKTQVNDTTAEGVLQDGLTAMSDFGGWFGTLVILGVVTIIFLFLGVIRRAGDASQA